MELKLVGLYTFRQKITAPSTDDVTFTGPAVGRGKILEVTALSVVDFTTANKQLLVGFKDVENNEHLVDGYKATSNYGIGLSGILYLLEGEAPLGKVVSPTTSNVCYFTCHGKLYETA